jgi:hypothetical protein
MHSPSILRPRFCLNLVIQYVAKERVSGSCELVIHGDDPREPIRPLDCCKPRREECCDDDDDDHHHDRDEDDED